jgi:hypothetical protein
MLGSNNPSISKLKKKWGKTLYLVLKVGKICIENSKGN